MSGDPLQDLLDRLADGDLDAAEQTYRLCEPILRKVVRRQLPPRLRSRFDSLDIVQSVWGDVLDGFRDAGWRFASPAQLRAFLIRAARNRFIDRLRQNGRSLDRETPLDQGLDQVAESREPRPSETVQASELWEQLLALCPPGHRDVLRLKREGLLLAEIAQRTGLHADSVRRILRQLARDLALREQALAGSP